MPSPRLQNGYEQNGVTYKSPIGQIPKIVNNFKNDYHVVNNFDC